MFSSDTVSIEFSNKLILSSDWPVRVRLNQIHKKSNADDDKSFCGLSPRQREREKSDANILTAI